MEKIINYLYHNKFISSIFHTLPYCLDQALKGCRTVLDIGCGPDSPLKYSQIPYSVGVDVFKPYIDNSRKKKIHTKYITGDINKINFSNNSFDAVIMIDVLEHNTKKAGKEILKKAGKWAVKKIIVTTPNGYLPQKCIDKNIFQSHQSGWTIDEMTKLGYKAYGLAGFKFFRSENISEKYNTKGNIYSTIKFNPKILWLIISELSQLIAYYFPKIAFETFYIKKLNM